ncbi:MAG: HAMP domain-containing sensor histidine kinase [Planctomycetota bacterium]|nr:HAMP domain-containing sensor histidine kinase [Planctomycetota bacterium]
MADKQPIELSESEQLRLLKEQLARAQRMTALGELLGTTTHEYNNVLMTVLNYAKMGIRHKDEATRDKAFEKILAAGERAAKITNSILGLARNRSGDFEPTDLAKLVDDALVLLERELRKYRIAIETHLEDAPPARANPNQIQQVLLNLLINARQAMPNGGQVVIRVGLDQASGMVELSVRDNGPGIAEDKLPRIFDPYYSTKKGPDETGKGGTGVGLSACRDIMEAHQGKILVASTIGKGTAFTLRIPVAQNVAVAGTPTVPLGMPSTSSTLRTDR